MINLKWPVIPFLLWIFSYPLNAQVLQEKKMNPELTSVITLEAAQEAALQHYPVIKQIGITDSITHLSIENLQKNYLPQFSMGAQWTYQSDVTQIKIPIPGVTVNPLNKDQYKIQAEVSQLLYDGGSNIAQKKLQQGSAAVEKKKWDLELFRLRDRVRQIFVGILFFDAQLKQVDLAQTDVQTGIRKTQALVDNGLAFQSGVLLLRAELLKLGQRKTELSSGRKGLIYALSVYTGQGLDESTLFISPELKNSESQLLNRPEISIFEQQSLVSENQKELISAKSKPKASLFVQGGYGRPGLNFLKNDPALFYIGGVRLNWSLSVLYTRKNELAQIGFQKQSLALQSDQFVLQTRALEKQQDAEIQKLADLLKADDEIILLREQINVSVKAQLENGVITATDYLREINATDQARQSKASHQVLLLQAQLNKQTLLGN